MKAASDPGPQPAPTAPARCANAAPAGGRRLIQSSELFAGACAELEIEHNGEVYCLRRTSKGKLILTK